MLQNPVGYTLMQIGTSGKITWFKGGRRKMQLKAFYSIQEQNGGALSSALCPFYMTLL
jgi:hypothetical protein